MIHASINNLPRELSAKLFIVHCTIRFTLMAGEELTALPAAFETGARSHKHSFDVVLRADAPHSHSIVAGGLLETS